VERFFREARAAAAIGSPHIVEIYDCGTTHTGQPFISMELLEGSTLDKMLGKGAPLSMERAVDIAIQLLEGLSAAHGAGITHRDLKPANIFLCRGPGAAEEDFLKILDFGASKVHAHALQKALTRTGAWIGTPAYMSPEQFLGARDVDHRADLYAAAVVLYEMLSDSLPVVASTAAEMATKVLSSPPRSLAELRPGLPPSLCGVIERGLAKDPDGRYPDAAAFAAALQEATGLGPAGSAADWMLRSTQASNPGPPPSGGASSTGGVYAAVAASGAGGAVSATPAPPPPAPEYGAVAVATPPPAAMVPAPSPGLSAVQGSPPPSAGAATASGASPPKRYLVLVAVIALLGGMIGGGIVSGAIALVTGLATTDEPVTPETGGGGSASGGGAAWAPQNHNGTIAQPGGRVRYPLRVTTGRTFTIFVQGTGLDPTVRVVDQTGAQLGFDDDGGGGLNSRLMLHLQPGDYFVEVGGFGSSTGAFSCSIN
jgi:serine/threonine-protein kinase